MAIYKSDIVDIDMDKGSIYRKFISRSIGTADNAADRFGVRVFRSGEEVDLSGCSCYGYFRDPKGNNIAITSAGTVDGNLAYITLPQACYNYDGQFCLAIKLIGGGVTGTVRIIDGVVDNTNTGSAVAPTSAVPTYTEILSQYDAMVAATAAANTAIAPTFAQGTAYAAGALVINDGALYALPNGHTAGTTWANTTKVATNLGDQVTSLKSVIINTETAINPDESALLWKKGGEKGVSYTDGTLVTSSAFAYTDYIDVSAYKQITYKRVKTTASTTATGMAWYSSESESSFISGVESIANASDMNPVDNTVTVPSTAKYARFTYRKDTATYGDFSITGVSKIYTDINNLQSNVNAISDSVGVMKWYGKNGEVTAVPSSSTGTRVGYKNDGNIITINGTSAIDTIRTRISNGFYRAGNADALKSNTGTLIPLIRDHTYTIRFNEISGTISNDAKIYVILRTSAHKDIATIGASGLGKFTWPSASGGYMFVYGTGMSGITFDQYTFSVSLVDATVGYDYYMLKNELTEEITPSRSLFIYHKTLNDSADVVDDNACAYSYSIRIKAPVIIKVDSEQTILFKSLKNGSSTPTQFLHECVLPELYHQIVVMRNGADLVETDIDKLKIYTTPEGKKDYEERMLVHIENTQAFSNYGSNGIGRYLLGTTSGSGLGMMIPNNSGKRATYKPYISSNDIDLYVGQYGTMTVNIIINNELVATLSNGEKYHIPANTPFTCGFGSTSEGYEKNSTSNTIMVVSGDNIPLGISQLTTNTTCSRADASFVVGDKVFFITYRNDGEYSVKQGSTFLVSNQTMDHSPGHANSCNYADGYVYVSDWRDNPADIVVYAVDAENNTLTYSKTITVPFKEGRGSTEYFVFDNENQIYFIGWQQGAAGTNPNTLVYGLFVKTTEGYVLAWERFAKRIGILQGFTVQGDYMYLVDNDAEYNFTGLKRINLGTGEIEYNRINHSGSIASAEVEQVIPIGNQVFLATDKNGKTYIHSFALKQRS